VTGVSKQIFPSNNSSLSPPLPALVRNDAEQKKQPAMIAIGLKVQKPWGSAGSGRSRAETLAKWRDGLRWGKISRRCTCRSSDFSTYRLPWFVVGLINSMGRRTFGAVLTGRMVSRNATCRARHYHISGAGRRRWRMKGEERVKNNDGHNSNNHTAGPQMEVAGDPLCIRSIQVKKPRKREGKEKNWCVCTKGLEAV
jgi:hypothetical protein